eukprot:scaffold43986_cov59-Phaeocystis_antarctica.AAC.7
MFATRGRKQWENYGAYNRLLVRDTMVHPRMLSASTRTHKPAVLKAVVLRKRLDDVVAVVALDGAFTLGTEQLGRI